MSFAVIYNFEIMVCLFYTIFPGYIKHVLCGTVVRVLGLHSSDWNSNPPKDILDDDGKFAFFFVGYLDILRIFFQTLLGVLVKHLYFALVIPIKSKFAIFWSIIWTF